MPIMKKLKSVFNRVANKGVAIATAGVMSLGIGIGTMNAVDVTASSERPAQTETYDPNALYRQAWDFARTAEKLDFERDALNAAKRNLGTGNSALSEQFASLDKAYAAHRKNTGENGQRVADYMKQIWFNPGMSEQDAQRAIRDGEKNVGGYYRYTSGGPSYYTVGQLQFRDEMREKFGLPADPAKITNEQLWQVVEAADNAYEMNAWQQGGALLGGGFASLLLGLGLVRLGYGNRWRLMDEESKPSPAIEPARPDTPKPTPAPVASEETPPPAPQAQPGPKKFAV